MARQTYLTTDPEALKPIVEALIFASEEPLAARLLVRFLAGEREEKGRGGEGASGGVDDEREGTEVAAVPVEGEREGEVEAGAEEGVEGDVGEGEDAGGEGEGNEEADGEGENVVELAEAAERADERAAGMLTGDGFGEPIDQRLLRRLIDELNTEYQESGRAFRIVEIAGGFQFATLREYGEYVALLSKEKGRRRLSPAALETLAIIAYRQPVAKPELESIRGVNSDQVLLSLLEKNLIAITGRADTVGRPLLYGTTDEFLRIFGLNSLSDLPRLREIEELMEEDAYSAERVETITIAESSDVEEIEARVGAAGRMGEGESGGGGEGEIKEGAHDDTLVFDMSTGEEEGSDEGTTGRSEGEEGVGGDMDRENEPDREPDADDDRETESGAEIDAVTDEGEDHEQKHLSHNHG